MYENAYRARAERGEVQIGTWLTMIRTPAVLTLLRAAGLDFARIDMEVSGR
jgi:2-keto-3-deoxy-L-rhamnonate aldolase RhmA